VFVQIAGVLFAGKAGELLTLRAREGGIDVNQQIEIIETLTRSFDISCLVLCRKKCCARAVVYNPTEVKKTLSMTPGWFFEKTDYHPAMGPDLFLKEIRRRWEQTDQIPHEIGLALGYPVKDVLGYMGLIPLPCTGRCGWRIHGNPLPSVRKSRRYEKAREKAVAFLRLLMRYDEPGRRPCSIPAVRLALSQSQAAEMASTGQCGTQRTDERPAQSLQRPSSIT
jgi:hypothetical protein